MSEDKKPKKDLRARLGRTIAPNTPGAAPIAPPAGVAPPAGIAPPAAAPVEAPAAAAGPAVTPPPAAVAPPVIAPPIAAPAALPFGGPNIAPPPFAQKAAPAEPKPEPKKRSADPFASGPAAPDQVRLIIDEKPADQEAARKQSGRTMAMVAVSVILGVLAGAGIGSVNGNRHLYNITVRDGQDVYEAFHTASEVVAEANQHVTAISTAASPSGGHPTVNYDEIAALVALENPLHAGAFARKNFARFHAETVDDLFAYDHNVQELWEDFQHLNAITAGSRRPTLDSTAAATSCPADLGHDAASAAAAIAAANGGTTDAANAQYVALLSAGDDGTISGTLGFAEVDIAADTHQPTGRTFMRAGRSGPGRAFDRWTPGTAIGSSGQYVIPVDGPASAAVLGDRAGAFRSFASSLAETRALMRETMALQERLTTALDEIHGLQEVFSL